MQPVCIYLLKDPRNNDVKYVGKTIQKTNDRLTSHIRQAKRNNNSRKDKWILEVVSEGHKPVVEVIEIARDDNWQQRERYWIVEYHNQGCDLVNETDGGEGLHGHKFSKKHISRITQTLYGNKRALGHKHTDEFSQEISERMTGEGNPNYGQTFSEEYRKKLSEAQTGRTHPKQTKQKMSNTRKEFYKDPANRKKASDAAKRRWANVRAKKANEAE